MATIIPTEGELLEVPAPGNPTEAQTVLGALGVVAHGAPDGSSWWVLDPPLVGDTAPNHRATRFYANRVGGTAPRTLYGKVLYMSADETKALNGAKPAEEMVPIRGRTYEVRDRLKAIGARWFAAEKVWKIAKANLAEAEEIVRRG